ncbi:phage tail assembly protein [uncultured Kiloniella sp.]|uniref:phage tail assembly protein n=1 Tax=uncultured Kiloniella sp. TaxID=1133091 RepID=UPI00261EA544|nr:phage tail assembly protein [uncultured Kiloniella sp.]
MDKIEVELTKPIQAHGDEVSVLSLKEPTWGDMMKMGKATDDMAKVASIIESCAEIPLSSVKSMSPQDVGNAMKALAPFLGGFQGTGED